MPILSYISGVVTTEEAAEKNRRTKPIALSRAVVNEAFQEAGNLRKQIFSDNWIDDSVQWSHLAGRLGGMEEAFLTLGIIEDYFSYLSSH